jgi:hypothetical protein
MKTSKKNSALILVSGGVKFQEKNPLKSGAKNPVTGGFGAPNTPTANYSRNVYNNTLTQAQEKGVNLTPGSKGELIGRNSGSVIPPAKTPGVNNAPNLFSSRNGSDS